MKREIPTRSGDEADALTTKQRGWRIDAPLRGWIKAKFNRRARRLARQRAKRETGE